MSKVFKFNRNTSLLEINIEDEIYTIDFDKAPKFSPKLIEIGTEMGKIKVEDKKSIDAFIKSSNIAINLLFGKGSFEKIFKDIPKSPENIIQLLNYILDEVNIFNEERFTNKYNV